MRFRAPLAESGKGSFYNQEKLLDELNRNHEASEQAKVTVNSKYSYKKLSWQRKLTTRRGRS